MQKKKVLIIGAGIAGLSAGSYLARNGYDVEIFEAHNKPGGVCTAWKRGGYTFDYCIHWLMGTRPGTGFDTIWKELGMLEDENGKPTEIVNFKEFTRIELSDGETICLYADADKLRDEFMRVAPEDEKMINRFVKDLKELARGDIPVVTEDWGLKGRIGYYFKNVTPIMTMFRYMRMPLGKFAERWKSPKLQEVFGCIIPPSWSAIALVFGLAYQHVQAAGYPVGGSLPLARNIERRLLALGGRINYSARVEKIIVSDSRAVGIKLASGEEHFGDDIVSAADGYTTLYRMLDGLYLSPQLRKVYEEYSLFPSSVFLGFGVAKDLSEMPHAIAISLKEPLVLPDGSQHEHISVNVYNFDPTLAPKGKTAVTVIINTWEDSYWKELAIKDHKQYKKTKSGIADEVLKILDDKFPGFSTSVEKIDVSTPHTVQRYTGNWHGSYEGIAPTPEAMMAKLPKQVPGLKNCHMIGQWTAPGGGLPPAALDGRNLTRKLCKRDNKKFVTFD